MKKRFKLAAASLGLLGLMISCGVGFNLGLTPTISGQISGYSSGAKVIKISRSGGAPIVTGTLKADGSFSVTLPSLTTGLEVLNTTCTTGTSTQTPIDAKSASVDAKVFDTDVSPSPVGSLTQTEDSPATFVVGTKVTLVARIYFDKDATLTFTNCANGSTTVNGTWNMKAGWNEVNYVIEAIEVSGAGALTKAKLTVGMGTAGKPWRFAGTSSLSPFKTGLFGQ